MTVSNLDTMAKLRLMERLAPSDADTRCRALEQTLARERELRRLAEKRYFDLRIDAVDELMRLRAEIRRLTDMLARRPA